MRICGACGGSGQDQNCSRSADCLTCEGVGYLPDGAAVDIPASTIVDAIEALEDYATSGTIEQSRRRCRVIANELQNWFDEA